MEFLYSTENPLGRVAFAIRFFLILAVGTVVTLFLYDKGYHLLHFKPVGYFWGILGAFYFGWAACVQFMRRLKDLDIPGIYAFVPVLNIYFLALAFFKAGKLES